MTDTDLLDRASTLVPTLRLEVADVIAAGRRRRRDRAARVVGACAAVLLVAVVAADRLPFPTGQPAAGADFGTGPSVELAPGIRATNTLDEQQTGSGERWWDLGIATPGPGHFLRQGLREAARPGSQDESATLSDPPGVAGLAFGSYDTELSAFTPLLSDVTWRTADGTATLSTATAAVEDGSTATRTTIGVVPAGLAAPRVVMAFPHRLGTGLPAFLELPTFTSPVDPGVALFAVSIDESAVGLVPNATLSPVVAFVGADGTVNLSDACGRTSVAACSQTYDVDLAAAIRSVGGDVTD